MPPTSASTHLSPAELSYLHTSLSSHPPIRPDSRTATDFRPLNAETGVLPNTMGSAHVGFADGREAVVGVRAEVEKTLRRAGTLQDTQEDSTGNTDVEMMDSEGQPKNRPLRGKGDWVTLGLTLPGTRDDDKDVVFLEEMLRETLVALPLFSSSPSEDTAQNSDGIKAQSLPDALVINYRWHWHLYVDVLLISAPDQAISSSTSGSSSNSGNYPLPLLSMAIHLALRNTRLPRLKSEGDEDPVADDDWDAAVDLYSKPNKNAKSTAGARTALLQPNFVPPVTLLVMVVAENVIFDPSTTELAVADGVLAITVGRVSGLAFKEDEDIPIKVLAMRTLETPARDTMKGVPRDGTEGADTELGSGTDKIIPGVWKPKVGGIKRTMLINIIKTVITGGVGKEVLDGLDGFLSNT